MTDSYCEQIGAEVTDSGVGGAEAREMTFDELIDEACKAAKLPEMARMQLPSALSDKTKKMISKFSPEEVGKMLSSAINAVNQGSVETIDTLVREQLNK